ncbi:amino acid ABC transporter substrate-binding protein [Mordavella massiliensis]|jgi:polar amino acid transport system substrate-binding protein|uniref:Amino acid ABC transporter substrate-binding protein n=1 Tax=Mordavella massiliensis TaxID=1871024 RepID=A0A938WYS7_9CLOT|nr:amino acid ABC transporter substrate-binding protein [Mordavella massiliensis]MBM6825510.1 amino acid ABC transporter substrate-binding protein [Mordavella massiliensis]
MKKRVTLLLALMSASAMLAAGCGGGSESTGAEETGGDTSKEETASFEEKQEGDTFTVGFDQNFPPMGFVGDDGEYTGFDLDLAKEVCERQGWEFVPQPIAWETKDATLNSGEIDCIWNGFTMNGREDEYTWSDPYLDNQQVFVVRSDSGIESEEDLAGKIVDVQTESSAQAALDDNPELADTFGTLQVIPDYDTGFMELESGAVDAVAMDIVVASYQIESRGADFTILDESIASEEYGIGFAKGNEALRDTVQATLEEMAADGTMAEISEKWFGEDITTIGK